MTVRAAKNLQLKIKILVMIFLITSLKRSEPYGYSRTYNIQYSDELFGEEMRGSSLPTYTPAPRRRALFCCTARLLLSSLRPVQIVAAIAFFSIKQVNCRSFRTIFTCSLAFSAHLSVSDNARKIEKCLERAIKACLRLSITERDFQRSCCCIGLSEQNGNASSVSLVSRLRMICRGCSPRSDLCGNSSILLGCTKKVYFFFFI